MSRYGSTTRRRSSAAEGATMANRYPGTCAWCQGALAPMSGIVTRTRGAWVASHRPATATYDNRWHGGCPGEVVDGLRVPGWRPATVEAPVTFRGRCIDAPCCDCC